jgi:DNA invertase Pin-like site-specific DNA recombinase
MKAAIWARVSTTDQHAENQLEVLRAWAASKGLEVTAEFVTEDSAWQGAKPGNGKGAEFDRQRKELVNGARLGRYDVVLLWAIDRLSRRGIEDTLATMRQLYGHGADLWSHQEGWLQTSEPHMRELLVSFMAWMAAQESQRRSERIKAGLARRKAEGKQVGGRQPGSKDKKKRATDGYTQAWEEGGARRAAQERATTVGA